MVARRLATAAADDIRVFPGLTSQADEYRALAIIHDGAYEWTDLRRTVATRLAGLGFDDTTIGRVLNHARYTVTSRHYIRHDYLEQVRQALDAWDKELRRVLDGRPKNKSKVLAMRRPS